MSESVPHSEPSISKMTPASSEAKVTREEVAVYRAGARSLEVHATSDRAQRRALAWKAARPAADLLRSRFGATRVVVFGSLVHENSFTRWSDVDVAAWGIDPEETFRAINAVITVSPDIEVNLTDVKTCTPSVLASIERDGVAL